MNRDRHRLLQQRSATIPAVRLFDELPNQPIITLPSAMKWLKSTKPTVSKAIDALVEAKILRETTGKQRDRVYAYHRYLEILTKE